MNRKHHILAITTLVSIALFLTACGSTAGGGTAAQQSPVELGERYLSELDFDSAILSFGEALEIDPKDEQALQGMGDAYRGRGNETARAGEEGSAEAARADYEQARSYYTQIPASSERAAEVQEEIARVDTLIAIESGEKAENWGEAYEWEQVKLMEWENYDEDLLRKGEYSLIYLNEDDIPELFMWFPEANGVPKHCVLLFYDPETGEVRAERFPGGEDEILEGFGYEEGTGWFFVEFSPTDPSLYEKGERIYLASVELLEIWKNDPLPGPMADYGMFGEFREGDPSSTGEPYTWGGFTREEYDEYCSGMFDRNKMTTFYENGQGTMKTMSYDDLLEVLLNPGGPDVAGIAGRSYQELYLDVIKELEEEYGELRVDPYQYIRYQDQNTEAAGGLLLTLLEDMNGDGIPELFTVTSPAEIGSFWGNIYTINGPKAEPLKTNRHEGFLLTKYYVDPDREFIEFLHTREHGIIIPNEYQDKETYMLVYYGVKDGAFQELFYYSEQRQGGQERQFYLDGEEVDLGDGDVDIAEMAAEWLGEYEEESYCVVGPAGSVEEDRLREQVEKVKAELGAAAE